MDDLYIPDYALCTNSYVQQVGYIVQVGYIKAQLWDGARVAWVAMAVTAPPAEIVTIVAVAATTTTLPAVHDAWLVQSISI